MERRLPANASVNQTSPVLSPGSPPPDHVRHKSAEDKGSSLSKYRARSEMRAQKPRKLNTTTMHGFPAPSKTRHRLSTMNEEAGATRHFARRSNPTAGATLKVYAQPCPYWRIDRQSRQQNTQNGNRILHLHTYEARDYLNVTGPAKAQAKGFCIRQSAARLTSPPSLRAASYSTSPKMATLVNA
jgi:hypothetical protein